jgi:hypothetical protein
MKITKKFLLLKLLLLSVMTQAPFAYASNFWINGKVQEILISDQYFGNCMVRIADYNPPSSCLATWITLDCQGTYNSKENSRRMLESIQMAFALDSDVRINITDQQKHNGWCVAKRVDLRKE